MEPTYTEWVSVEATTTPCTNDLEIKGKTNGRYRQSHQSQRGDLLKFAIRKEDRVKVIKNLGRPLLDELEYLFRSYWVQPLGVSDGLFQVLGHIVRVKTQEVQGYQLQVSEHHVDVSVY